jgi:hypothetical protein
MNQDHPILLGRVYARSGGIYKPVEKVSFIIYFHFILLCGLVLQETCQIGALHQVNEREQYTCVQKTEARLDLP